MSEISKDFLAVLMIITIVISAFGTIAAISNLVQYEDERYYEVPISKGSDMATARVTVEYMVDPEPNPALESRAEAQVGVDLIDEIQGG